MIIFGARQYIRLNEVKGWLNEVIWDPNPVFLSLSPLGTQKGNAL